MPLAQEKQQTSVKFVNKDGYDVNADTSDMDWEVDDTSVGTVSMVCLQLKVRV